MKKLYSIIGFLTVWLTAISVVGTILYCCTWANYLSDKEALENKGYFAVVKPPLVLDASQQMQLTVEDQNGTQYLFQRVNFEGEAPKTGQQVVFTKTFWDWAGGTKFVTIKEAR